MAATAIFAIWQHEHDKAIAADRTRFERADKDVQAISTEIQKAFPPQNQDYSKSCRKTRFGFEKPTVDCQVAYRAIYKVDNPSEANQDVDKVSDLLKSLPVLSGVHEVKGGDIFASRFTGIFSSTRKHEIRGETFNEKLNNLNCTVTYELFNPQSLPTGYLYISLVGSYNLLIDLECHGQARAPYFPQES